MGIKERKEREREMRRQQIQKATKDVFMLKDFKSTTMEDIAQKARILPAVSAGMSEANQLD